MVDELRTLMAEARRAVVFTGAGISTESGIPDFRSPGGLWTKMSPINFDDFLRSDELRREAWRRKFEIDKTIVSAEPNKGHMAVAKLVDTGKVTHVITQNIDNLHQNSGVPAAKIIELHGNGTYAKCLDCGLRHELVWVKMKFEAGGEAPTCRACNGIVKSATISFGQAMPEEEMRRAEEATLACDLFLAIGSSLQVFPAAGFPIIAKRNG
ncbi:MAG TPA: Sir2 family NAD-dependent protein deacetylase, partial [Parvibaculum sp.]